MADNEFNIGVSNGLLKSSNSTATSQAAATVQNAGATLGTLTGAHLPGLHAVSEEFSLPDLSALLTPSDSHACPAPGTSYQMLLYPENHSTVTLCDDDNKHFERGPYTLTWRRADLSAEAAARFGGDNRSAKSATPVSGIFFRHELPYLVTVRGPPSYAIKLDTVITSPDESETDFFPVKRSFFANNSANISITDGEITSVDQTTKSEVAAAVGLPAAFVGSYTAAVGQVFSSLSTNSADQQKLIQQVLSTNATQNQAAAVAVVQNQICAKTVASYNLANMSTADLAKAQTAIKAACPGS